MFQLPSSLRFSSALVFDASVACALRNLRCARAWKGPEASRKAGQNAFQRGAHASHKPDLATPHSSLIVGQVSRENRKRARQNGKAHGGGVILNAGLALRTWRLPASRDATFEASRRAELKPIASAPARLDREIKAVDGEALSGFGSREALRRILIKSRHLLGGGMRAGSEFSGSTTVIALALNPSMVRRVNRTLQRCETSISCAVKLPSVYRCKPYSR